MGPHARSESFGAPVFDDILESPEFRDFNTHGFYSDCCCQIVPCICKSYAPTQVRKKAYHMPHIPLYRLKR